jgi:hypothetical protein
MRQIKHKSNLTEGLRAKDLAGFIDNKISIDRFRSKMGEDQDVVVLAFAATEKYPAMDFMEFLEKGYSFILDADISAGEESDGHYKIFVEIPRSIKLPDQLDQLKSGISQVCDCYDWEFKYYQDSQYYPLSKEMVAEHVPLSVEDYDHHKLMTKQDKVKEFFDQGAVNVTLEADDTLTFEKSYAGDVTAKLVAMGDHDVIKDQIPGAISLDESSQSQVMFLTKFLGNYGIDKIGHNRFLINNGDKSVIIEKDL